MPPPTVHIHLKLHSDLSDIPSIRLSNLAPTPDSGADSELQKAAEDAVASPEEARAFELWLRNVWKEKDERLKRFVKEQKFEGDALEVIDLNRL